MTENDKELPASKMVEQFGDEIRAAIFAIADETPTVAKTVAKNEVKNEARRAHARWYLMSLTMALVMAVTVSWLMLYYAPRGHAVDITYRRGHVTDVCTRSIAESTEAHPIYLCQER